MVLIIWFIACFFGQSCSEDSRHPEAGIKNEQKSGQLNEGVELLIRQWKADSLGCEKLRTKAMAESIIDSLNLENADRTEFLKVFGNPNTTSQREGAFIDGYYFDALCVNGNFIDSADYCIAEFTFEQNKTVQRNYICH